MSEVFSLTPPFLLILFFFALGGVTIISVLLVVGRRGIKNRNALTRVMVLVLVTVFIGFFTVTSFMINVEIS